MASFADTDGDGIANVPAYYSTTHGRKLVDTSRSPPLALLKNPNKFTAVYAGLLAAAVLLIVLVVLLIRKSWSKGQTPRRIRPPLPKGRIGAILDTNTV